MCTRCLTQIDLKYPTVFIGTLHSILLTFRIFEIAKDMFLLEERIELSQVTYILLISLLQVFTVISLFVGAIKKQHFFLLPWLCFTAPTFCMATAYAILYVAAGDRVQSIMNFVFIAAFWASWCVVFECYLGMMAASGLCAHKGHEYSNLRRLNEERGTTV